MTTPNDTPRFSESQLRGIIARAVHPGSPKYSKSEIHEIAAELGIDSSAIDEAIASLEALERQSEAQVLGLVRCTSYGMTVGFASAASLLTPGLGGFAILGCGAMLVVSHVLTRSSGVSPYSNVTAFLRRNFVAWGSFMIGGTTFARFANPSWLGNESTVAGLSIAGLWLLSSLVGAAAARPGGTPPGDPDPSGAVTPTWRERLAARMKQWVDAILLHFEQSQHRRRQPSNGRRDAQPASATPGIGIHRMPGSVKLAGA